MRRTIGTIALFLAAVAATAVARADDEPRRSTTDVVTAVSKAYGIDQWKTISSLSFNFNVDTKDKKIRRHWDWNVETGRVTFEGTDETGKPLNFTYERSMMDNVDPDLTKKVDKWFINDQYWLLFPFHMVWDTDATFSVDPKLIMPIPPGSAERLVVTYGNGVGYTPGDVYELYIGRDNLIKQWVYRRGGNLETARPMTWENYDRVGPLLVSMKHVSVDKELKVWFSDVAVRLKAKEKLGS
jgi:hypothetical protein